jgi:hypothetical protein
VVRPTLICLGSNDWYMESLHSMNFLVQIPFERHGQLHMLLSILIVSSRIETLSTQCLGHNSYRPTLLFFILVFYALEVQLLMQIIINRIAVIAKRRPLMSLRNHTLSVQFHPVACMFTKLVTLHGPMTNILPKPWQNSI